MGCYIKEEYFHCVSEKNAIEDKREVEKIKVDEFFGLFTMFFKEHNFYKSSIIWKKVHTLVKKWQCY